jgi:uncharacterized protein DUF4962
MRGTILILLFVIFFTLFPLETVNAAEHPYLYFSNSELPGLRSQAAGEKALQFSRLRHWCDRNLDTAPPSGIGISERRHETCFSTITNYGILYQLTGELKYLQAGIRWLEALLATPAGSQGNYHIGIFAASLAHGYDFFYKGLNSEFRQRLKAKLIDVLEEARYGALHHWWAGVYTHHDFWIPIAGMGIAGLCLSGEYPAADSVVEFCVKELNSAVMLLGEQGYWPEGAADWVYGMAPTCMFFDALVRAGGPDFYKNPWMKATAGFRLRNWLPDESYLYLGDSYRSGRYGTLGSVSAHLLMRLASRYRDRHAQWLALRDAAVDSAGPPGLALEAPYSYGAWRLLPDRELHGLAWQFLWYDPTVKPLPPDSLPADMLYPNWDTAIFRAGWGASDPVLAFAGGHQLGKIGTTAWEAGNRRLSGGMAHVHQNAGSLYLWADGCFPLAPPSYGGRDGRFHSTVMVDGHGQLFQPDHRGRIVAYQPGRSWAMAAMELKGAYPPQLELDEYRRTLVFLKPRTILLVDRLATADGSKKYIRRYEWLLQTDATEADWVAGGDSISAIARDNGRPLLTGRVFCSTRYFFERQSMDRPNGRPMNRALSVTMIGRLPVDVEIAAVLKAPSENESSDRLSEINCLRSGQSTAMILPGESREGKRAVVFAAADSIVLDPQVSDCDFILIVGLASSRPYSLNPVEDDDGKRLRLLPDSQGKFLSSDSGNLLLKK